VSVCCLDVRATGTAGSTENERGVTATNKEKNTADEPRDSNDAGAPAANDGSSIQVHLDDVDDLPDVNSAEAANISSIR